VPEDRGLALGPAQADMCAENTRQVDADPAESLPDGLIPQSVRQCRVFEDQAALGAGPRIVPRFHPVVGRDGALRLEGHPAEPGDPPRLKPIQSALKGGRPGGPDGGTAGAAKPHFCIAPGVQGRIIGNPQSDNGIVEGSAITAVDGLNREVHPAVVLPGDLGTISAPATFVMIRSAHRIPYFLRSRLPAQAGIYQVPSGRSHLNLPAGLPVSKVRGRPSGTVG
jgi:hypothetical protein